MSTVLPTLTTSASQSLASLAGHMFVWLNAMTCLSLRQEHSLVDGVSMLQPQPSGTRFHHICAHHPSVVDSSWLGWKPISSHRPTDTSENFCWRAYSFTFTYYIKPTCSNAWLCRKSMWKVNDRFWRQSPHTHASYDDCIRLWLYCMVVTWKGSRGISLIRWTTAMSLVHVYVTKLQQLQLNVLVRQLTVGAASDRWRYRSRYLCFASSTCKLILITHFITTLVKDNCDFKQNIKIKNRKHILSDTDVTNQ